MSTNDEGGPSRIEPIDADFEEADRRAARGARERRGPSHGASSHSASSHGASGGVNFGAAALLAVLAAGVGAAGGAIGPRLASVDAVLDRAVPDQTAAPAAAGPSSPELAAIAVRLAEIEALTKISDAEIAAAGDGGANVAARVFAMQASLRDVETRLTAIPSSQEIGVLISEVQRMQQELPAIAAASQSAQDAARAAFAVAAASEAAHASGPFEQSVASLKALLPDDPNVAALEPLARTGAPTRAELRGDFEDVQTSVIRAARQAQAGSGFWGRIQAALAQWITVRRAGEGDTPDGVVERAQARLAADDLAGAIEELNRLSGAPARAAAPWLENARRRLAIDTYLAAIRTELSRRG